jgi:biotin operon repressor
MNDRRGEKRLGHGRTEELGLSEAAAAVRELRLQGIQIDQTLDRQLVVDLMALE